MSLNAIGLTLVFHFST